MSMTGVSNKLPYNKKGGPKSRNAGLYSKKLELTSVCVEWDDL